ncbi:Regulator of telomere elongation helicase 1 [Dissostichus eleginoides]|uniref:Regulator of telomere elongation helicase 1 n=1 Tax=Dissostichus eleginoides TaxID=100907 RepID=A0AAD9CEP3_DISEL|nr:Regulator of telomere elongation helicase 1 [Dissostichus eleginoides]
MGRSGLAALVDLAEGSGLIQLESALEGRVTEECLSLYNVDGSMRKIVKSKLLELFNLDPVIDDPRDHCSLVDMGLIWQLAAPHLKTVRPGSATAQSTSGPEDKFPGAAEFNELMVNSGNKVRLQKLLKEQLKTRVCRVQGEIIYCEGERSTNLGTGVASGDYVFKHPEAD